MSIQEPQVVDSQEFIDLLDYKFTGDISTVENKRKFINAYREEGSVYHAALAVGIHRTTVYKWLEADPAFVAAFDDCKEDTYDKAETSVYRKALNGDSLLLMFYLKAHRPKFRDKVSIDIQSVQDEIAQRMQQLNIKQLPGAVTEFLPTRGAQVEVSQLVDD